jgi:hypothetical protein
MRKTLLICCMLTPCCAPKAHGQGTFQNLGFESATLSVIPGDPYGRVQFAPAFQGWSGYVGGAQQTAALYDNIFLDSSGLSIVDTNWTNPLGGPAGVIQGRYTAILQAGWALGTFTPADTSLVQTGMVPLTAQSLMFRAFLSAPIDSFSVEMGGQQLPLTALGTGANYTVYGADIHSWAGQSVDLAFTVLAQRPHVDNYYAFLDSIQCSTQSVPEPGTFALCALAALLLGYRVLRAQA